VLIMRTILLVAAAALLASCGPTSLVVEGEQQVWKSLTLTFQGPAHTETGSAPNPFLDYRLQVHFESPSGTTYNIPGYFDGDTVWRARFTPDAPGEWTYTASFRSGTELAVSLDPDAGEPTAFDGATGTVTIAERDSNAPGFAKWGRLEYADGHYLKFIDGGYWIRGGTDSPESFLGYAGFDNTPPSHRFADHEEDWKPGDPDWGDGQGKAIIGALNYLADHHVNSVYMLTMNIGGDGRDVFPWAESADPAGSESNDNLHFDLSKLDQWETVFAHAQRLGIFLHLVLNEAEEPNKRELDDGELGVERKLYYRELIARFGHHLAMQWNLCEEFNHTFDLGPDRIRAYADYIRAVDPYDHPVTVHTAGNPLEELRFIFGDERFSITSVQLNQRRIDTLVEDFRRETAAAGRPLPISMDEFTIDVGTNKSWIPVDDMDAQRRTKLWPTLLSGGMIEFILEGLIVVDTFKGERREPLWDYTWYARKFLEALPFNEMEPADELVKGAGTIRVGLGEGKTFQLGAQVFAQLGEVYAIYLPKAQPSGRLDLTAATGEFSAQWYNPRTGEFVGPERTLAGGGVRPLGLPPADTEDDWALLLKRSD
jgi:uncharacterized protein DUF5060/collagenase-like protein with putative collagen-binding domain